MKSALQQRSFAATALCAALGLGSLGACDDEAGEPEVTWHRDIAPLLGRHCLGCHSDGGIGPMRFDTLELAREGAPLILGAIESGKMPPWLPARDCHPIAGERSVSQDERDLLRAWIDGGMAKGLASSAPTVSVERFQAGEMLAVAVGYQPPGDAVDDYHCFVLDREFERDSYVVASDVVVGSGQVHHALVYAIKPSNLEEMTARDAAAPGPGYPCFAQPISTGFANTEAFLTYLGGGDLPNFDFPIQLGAWVPGTVPRVLPADTAYRIPAGSKLVVQIHYSLQGAPKPDWTTLGLSFTDLEPTTLLRTRPVAVLDLDIPAGARGLSQGRAFPYHASEPLEIVGVMAHMHLLGSGFRATVQSTGQAESCLLDIPEWDFHWQESYRFAEGDAVIVRPGDDVAVTCTYDNGPEDQPLDASGVRRAPRHVTWGEGTHDEMCLFYYTSKHRFTPVEPVSGSLCAPAAGCVAACAQGADHASLACVLECSEASTECQLCSVRAGLQCSDLACLPNIAAASDCMVTCLEASLMLGTNLGRCLRAECAEAYDGALSCLDAALGEADCRARFTECGIDFGVSGR